MSRDKCIYSTKLPKVNSDILRMLGHDPQVEFT